MPEERVPQVVLDVARGANEDSAHEESEHGADARDPEQQAGIQRQLGAGDADVQVVDRVFEDPGREELDRSGDDDARQPEHVGATVAEDEREETPKGTHSVKYEGRRKRAERRKREFHLLPLPFFPLPSCLSLEDEPRSQL